MSDNKNTPSAGEDATGNNGKNSNQNGKNNPWNKKQPGGNGGKNPNPPPNKNTKFQGATKGIEDATFYYGPGMDTKYMTSKEIVLDYIGSKYSASEQVSIEENKITLLGHQYPEKIQSKTELELKPLWEQTQWANDMKRYNDSMYLLQKNLTACYPILWGQCTTSLQNQIKREAKFKGIKSIRDAPGLFSLITKVCNKGTNIDHSMTTAVEALFTIIHLSGNKMSLGEYYKVFNVKRQILENSGVAFRNPELIAEQEQGMCVKYGWDPKASPVDPNYTEWKAIADVATEEQFYTMIFLRNAGDRYNEVRRGIKNDFAKGNDNIPETVEMAYSMLQQYQLEPKKKPAPNTKKGNGSNDQNDSNPNSKAKFPAHTFQQQDFD